MIFENAYGEWLKKQLNDAIQKVKPAAVVKLFQDIAYKPLVNNPDIIALILHGGNASRSTVEGLDQNIMPMSVTILCKDEYKTAVRNALDSLQENLNSKPTTMKYIDNVSGDEYIEKVKTIFNTPFILNEQDYRTEKGQETIKVTTLQMTASVIYGKNAYIHPTAFYLKIDGKDYEIENIADYNRASSPAYDEYQSQGRDDMQRNFLTDCKAYSFTLYRVQGNALQEILENELLGAKNGLRDRDLTLCAYDADSAYRAEFKVTKYNLTESYINNASAFLLVLSR